MSNYPPPYPGPPAYPSPYPGPPVGYYPPPPGAGSPAARRAGLLMFITGGLLLLFGACDVIQSAVISPAQWQASMQQQQAAMGQAGANMPTLSVGTMRTVSLVIGALMLIFGATAVGLGLGVRRGGRGPTIAALVVTALVAVASGLVILLCVVAGTQAPAMFAMGCVFVIPAALAGLQIAWLVGALRAGPGRVDPYQQYLAQYQYHQQMAQSYGAPAAPSGYGYGYGLAPPPPPVVPSPPPPPPPGQTNGPAA